jgi:hypothetical protein
MTTGQLDLPLAKDITLDAMRCELQGTRANVIGSATTISSNAASAVTYLAFAERRRNNRKATANSTAIAAACQSE